ncbi:MAG TPA: DMT family transporter [Devosiaceae bacterium]|jgi:drug/metabolite transporter (DMT)-like permease
MNDFLRRLGGKLPAGDSVGLGIGLTLISILVFGIQDAFSKILVADYSTFQIAMMRYWGFAAFSLYLVARQGPLRQALKSQAPGLQALRGVLLVLDIWLYAIALKNVPLAELQAISLIYPLLVTLIAIPLLGEKVGLFRVGAVVVGFIGAMIIVRPGGLALGIGVLAAVLSAAAYALYIVITRKMATRDSTATSMAYTGIIGLVMTSAAGVFFWQPMDGRALLMVTIVMVTTCMGHGLMMKALSLVPASLIQPFNYFSLPWAIFLSYVVFGHLIDPISLIGAVVITAAGLVVMMRERLKGIRSARAEAPLPGKE